MLFSTEVVLGSAPTADTPYTCDLPMPCLDRPAAFLMYVDFSPYVPKRLDDGLASAGSVDVGAGTVPKLGSVTLSAGYGIYAKINGM